MEEAPENGKESPHSVHANGLIDWKSLYMFRVSQHLSSGVLKTVTTASGTGHTGLTGMNSSQSLYFTVWPVPEAAVTVFSTPDGCCDTQNM